MKKSSFNPSAQFTDTTSKIVVGLERISEAFRVLLWEHAKVIGLSPIQIQLLIFVAYHEEKLCNVSHLANEFNMTKATISDAIKMLLNKGLIEKKISEVDKRAYSVLLTDQGKKVVEETEQFANPIKKALAGIELQDQQQLFQQLSKVIYSLNQAGILSVQRTCYGCRFYEKKNNSHYCRLLEKKLFDQDIRIDCPEYEKRSD